MFDNFYGRGIGSIPFRETAVHLFELAFALSATKDSLPLESCSNKAQDRKGLKSYHNKNKNKNKNKWESPCYTCYKKAGN